MEKNEAKADDMVDILEAYQAYCPVVNGAKDPISVGGDGLTAKRGEEAQLARCDGPTPEARLEGIVVKVEDWHKDTMVMMKVFGNMAAVIFKFSIFRSNT